jgi:hypothetical protein
LIVSLVYYLSWAVLARRGVVMGMDAATVARWEPAASRIACKKGAVLIPLTEPEIWRLSPVIIWPRLTSIERPLVWGDWRRHHQAVTPATHYRRKTNAQLRTRVENHERESCWQRNRRGRICYAALYMPGSTKERRQAVEEEVRRQFSPACGVR